MKLDRIINGVELTIQFHYVPYIPGRRSYNPPDGGYVTVEDIYHKEESIYMLIESTIISKLEKELYEEIVESEK
tara:strand:+ start:1549 stop:1770 length:222 start_codon:yes stop_codon:yes gene_type:complete